MHRQNKKNNNMEFRQLESLIAVAECGRVSSAAIRCNLTQGAVSQQIRQLEDELDTQLFIRTKTEMKLTDAGSRLLEYARDIVQKVRSGKDDILAMKGTISGELKIGAGSLIEPFVGRAIAEFMTKYPNVRISVQYDYSSVLNRQLRNHELDIAFSMNKSYPGEGIHSEPCFRFEMCAVMRNDNELSKKEIVTFDDVVSHRMILPDIGVRETDTMQQYAGVDVRRILNSSIGDTNNVNALLNSIRYLGVISLLPPEYAMMKQEIVSRPVKEFNKKMVCYCHTMENVQIKASASALLDIIKRSEYLDIV